MIEFIINNWMISLLSLVILYTAFNYFKDDLLRKGKVKSQSLSDIEKISVLNEWFELNKPKPNLNVICPNSKETRLIQAILKNELKFAKALLSLGADASAKNSAGETAMHVTMRMMDGKSDLKEGEIAKFRKLLWKSRYEIETKDAEGYTVLHNAVRSNDKSLIKEFLSKKASLATTNNIGHGLIHTATPIHDLDLITLLIKKGVDINHKDNYGDSPLHMMVVSSGEESCKKLIKAGADVELKNNQGERPLHLASKNGTENLTKLLLESGSEVDPVDDNGQTPLIVATDYDNVNIMDLLIVSGADIEKKDIQGNSPLLIAVSKENPATTKLLLENKADINATDNNARTPLILLVRNSNNNELLDTLIGYSANLNDADYDNQTAIMQAVALNKDKFMVKLLDAGAEIDKANDNIITSALKHNNEFATNKLIIHGAKVSEANLRDTIEKDNKGLMRIVTQPYMGNHSLLKSLLERSVKSGKPQATKALIEIVDPDQTSSIAIAASLGYQQMLDILLEKSANPTFTKLINKLTISNTMGDAVLTLADLIQTEIGGEIIYLTNDKKFRIAQFAFDVEKELDLERVSLQDNRDGSHSVFFYNSTPLGHLMKDLKINDRNVEFIKTESQGISKSILLSHIDGSTINQWFDKQGYIEDILKIPVKIEMYDKTHELYGKYGKSKMIIIKESDLSSIPSLCGLSGTFTQEKDNHGVAEIHFSGVSDENEWIDNQQKISDLLGKKVTIDVVNDKETKNLRKVILRISIEYSIPELLDWNDSKHIPVLLHSQQENGNNSYFYSYSHSKDLSAWKEASRRVNFKTLFDQPDKVYVLEQYSRENKNLWDKYADKFEEKQMIVLHEYAAIPSKGELMEFEPSTQMKAGEVLWGYGTGSTKYYTDINEMAHMMIIGGTGSGKSNFINGIILSLLHSLDSIQKMYLIDLKSGIEFNRYKNINPNKVDVFSKGTSPSKLLSALKEVEAEMCLREMYMAENEIVQYPNDPIFIIIDEYAQIELMPAKGMEMMAKDDILDLLVRIGTKARSANIKLIVQTQNPRAVQDDLKSNLMSRALLKTSKANDLSLTLQDEDLAYDLGLKHISFDKGRYIFEDYNDGDTKMNELQFPYIDANKKYQELYKGTKSASSTKKFDKYKQEVVDDYPYLAETKVLSGVVTSEKSVGGDSSGDATASEAETQINTATPFDFNAMLNKNQDEPQGSTEMRDVDEEEHIKELKEIANMDSDAINMLNELIGDGEL